MCMTVAAAVACAQPSAGHSRHAHPSPRCVHTDCMSPHALSMWITVEATSRPIGRAGRQEAYHVLHISMHGHGGSPQAACPRCLAGTPSPSSLCTRHTCPAAHMQLLAVCVTADVHLALTCLPPLRWCVRHTLHLCLNVCVGSCSVDYRSRSAGQPWSQC